MWRCCCTHTVENLIYKLIAFFHVSPTTTTTRAYTQNSCNWFAGVALFIKRDLLWRSNKPPAYPGLPATVADAAAQVPESFAPLPMCLTIPSRLSCRRTRSPRMTTIRFYWRGSWRRAEGESNLIRGWWPLHENHHHHIIIIIIISRWESKVSERLFGDIIYQFTKFSARVRACKLLARRESFTFLIGYTSAHSPKKRTKNKKKQKRITKWFFFGAAHLECLVFSPTTWSSAS